MTAAVRSDVDGRTARRDRNREAVLDAVLALFREDNLAPRPEDVAERSGVSLRSVYRYYSDPAELLRAAMARHLERVEPKFAVPDIGEGSLTDRIDRLVDARLTLYAAVAPTARAARVAAGRNPVIREQYTRTRRYLRDQVEEHFRPELERLPAARRRAITTAADALVQLEVLDYYRGVCGMTKRETRDVIRVALAKLLGP